MNSNSTKVALVTGAAQGLGYVICESLIKAGYSVVVSDIDADTARSAALALDDSGKKALSVKLDVMQKQDFAHALTFTTEAFGHCDLLVNNAAMTPTTAVMDITPEEFSQVLDINLRGNFLGCQVFGQYFADKGFGRIVNLASLAGQMGGTASGAHYASSKAGIMTLTKIFARQFADAGVTVNAIAPGPVDVPSVRDKVPAEKLEQIINNMIPVKAMSNPAFIGSMVVMLAADEANTVTGATWDINGGIFMR
ncbi:SDR family NAD(P)-dependent oxidoreductase [Paraglaciecola chathamensis]|uniref:(R,R)-butanediol dehydrogenase n=1 Tax=Paraglaciecola agarilytica NO2 TaxID=1125747 RepID=A0ABQ0I8N8_9ALTE|nr:SDR family oxidoreductase [Paraglaciecola agarilytica]GAC05708.1 (R,R)-butanediol dehydrogenase [Paraglaciecola agarilytica NO2]